MPIRNLHKRSKPLQGQAKQSDLHHCCAWYDGNYVLNLFMDLTRVSNPDLQPHRVPHVTKYVSHSSKQTPIKHCSRVRGGLCQRHQDRCLQCAGARTRLT